MNKIYQTEDELDTNFTLNFIRLLWSKRKFIFKITFIFILVGLFIGVFTKNEFTASTTIIPQTDQSTGSSGNLGGLAAIAGINIGNLGGESGISPKLYPQILNSIPFQKELIQTPISFSEFDEKISYENYYKNYYKLGVLGTIKKYTIGLPRLLISAISKSTNSEMKISNNNHNNELLRITLKEKELIIQIQSQLHLVVFDKDGYIKLSCVMPDPLAAAELTKIAQELLQKYIINFKIQKSKFQLDFINERYLEKEKEFKNNQKKLANYRDQNQNVNSASAKTALEQLQSEYDLSYSVYVEIAKQLEKQQIQVKQDTPVFTVIEPVSVPIEKSRPRRLLLLLGWGFMGLFMSSILVFSNIAIRNLKKNF